MIYDLLIFSQICCIIAIEVIKMSIDHDLHQMLFQQREAQTQHLEYNQEFQYYNAIASGDIENVSRYFMKEDDQAYLSLIHI